MHRTITGAMGRSAMGMRGMRGMMGMMGMAGVVAACAGGAMAQLQLVNTFPTSPAVGVGFDSTTGEVWVYPEFSSVLRRYSVSGALLGSIQRPGEPANDADVEVTGTPFTLGPSTYPAGTLLFINGEQGTCELYVVDKTTGAVGLTFNASFGNSHVVGGAVHPQRASLFFVQDRVPGDATLRSRVAEVDTWTAFVTQSFQTTTANPTFTVNYGDIDVARNNNLLIVSSDEEAILEVTPTGQFVALHPLPQGVTDLAGIAVDDASCDIWVISSLGVVSRVRSPLGSSLCPLVCDAIDFNRDTLTPDSGDLDDFIAVLAGGPTACSTFPAPGCGDLDFNNDGLFPDAADLDAFISRLSGGPCL